MKKSIILFLSILSLSACRDKTTDPINSSDTTQVPTDGLIAYYSFNGNANDLSGNNFHGDVSGAVLTTDRFGNTGKAYQFDGNNDYIAVPNTSNSKLEPSSQLTISCFIKANSVHGMNEFSRIIRKTASFDNGYELNWDMARRGMLQGALLANCIPSAFHTPSDKVSFPNNELVGNWHHIAVTYSKSTEVFKLYIDGELVSEQRDCIYNFEQSLDTLFIGGSDGILDANRNLVKETFPGKIDDIRIYERALIAAEIQALYHEGGFGI
ncbi:MAG: LamG domain-containing protein [Bacteroidota bacterium]